MNSLIKIFLLLLTSIPLAYSQVTFVGTALTNPEDCDGNLLPSNLTAHFYVITPNLQNAIIANDASYISDFLLSNTPFASAQSSNYFGSINYSLSSQPIYVEGSSFCAIITNGWFHYLYFGHNWAIPPNGGYVGPISESHPLLCHIELSGIDSDGDGVDNNVDVFPNDPAETEDSDGDGVGNNSDAFPADPTETEDKDGDGVGNNSDMFPADPTETEDSDGDGIGNNSDAFPTISTQDVVNEITNNPSVYNLYSVDDVADLRPGSTIIEVAENQATVQLQMEESSDLQTWEDTGTPATMTIPADTDTKFFRFKMVE